MPSIIGATEETEQTEGIAGEGPVADNVVRPFDGNVEHRRAIYIDSDLVQFVGDQSGIDIDRFARGAGIGGVECTETRGRGSRFASAAA